MSSYLQQPRFKIYLAFALVYLFWGSTYLGIDLAVEHIPAALMAGIRFSVAGAVMLAYCHFTRRGITLTRHQFVQQLVIGILLLSISNVVLAWAENYLPTGLASLLTSFAPVWFLLIEAAMRSGEHPTGRGYVGVAFGILGIAVLLWPDLRSTGILHRRDLLVSLCLLGGSCCWAFGSVLARHWKSDLDPFSGSGWQMAFAGIINILVGLALGDHHHADWSWKGFAAIGYLIVFGSWVGFSAYVYLLKHVPTAKVATYAYINPIVAVFLGWLVLHERIDRYMAIGAAITICAVALVTGAKLKKKAGPEEAPALPEVEAGAD